MNIKKQEFDIEESMRRVSKILDTSNSVISVAGDYDIDSLTSYQTVDCRMVCLSVTLYINKFDLDKDENLFKQYKCLLSEFGAVINECERAVEYTVVGKTIFTTLFRALNDEPLDRVIDVAAKLCSLLFILNRRFSEANLSPLNIGVGVSFNKMKLTREAFSTSVDTEFLWSGEALDESIKLSQFARTGFLGNSLLITKTVYERLPEPYRNFFTYDNNTDAFASSLINKNLEAWEKEHL